MFFEVELVDLDTFDLLEFSLLLLGLAKTGLFFLGHMFNLKLIFFSTLVPTGGLLVVIEKILLITHF